MMDLDLQKVLPAEAFETEQNEGDYIGKDGLLYCGVCRTKKQTRLPASDFTGGREMIVPCICKCKVEENKRKEEEEKKRQEMQRLERLKASSLMDAKLKAARLDGYQVDGDNQKIYNLAGNYVKRFDEMYEKRQGLGMKCGPGQLDMDTLEHLNNLQAELDRTKAELREAKSGPDYKLLYDQLIEKMLSR